MIKKIIKLKTLVICLVMIILSIGCFYISAIKWGGEIVSSIVSNLGGVVFISGIFTIVDKYIIQRDLVSLVTEKVDLKKEVEESGIIKLARELSDVEYKKYFLAAKDSIDIVHLYGKTWTSTYIEHIKDAIDRGCNVRVILLNPESAFIKPLEEHFQYSENQLENLIKEVSEMWNKHCYCKLGSKNKGNISLYYHKGQPTNSLYRIDNKMVVVQTKTTHEKTTRMPAYVFEKNNNEGNFFDIYLKEIDSLEKESEKIDFENL
ncbi:hypothetical protein HF875_08080 [Paraclostridium bifermentans]|uniref:Uncharacterized protein n=1 Tax=Paraclostridium bifermentans TaxID=1490 RepID=A0AA44IH13_PARBF|nr:hypothetical protein [Paraclostridium bifermentans]NME09475.1 hypothetical protein [Paraclostridium bifermentans]